jgi:hypothetical protein
VLAVFRARGSSWAPPWAFCRWRPDWPRLGTIASLLALAIRADHLWAGRAGLDHGCRSVLRLDHLLRLPPRRRAARDRRRGRLRSGCVLRLAARLETRSRDLMRNRSRYPLTPLPERVCGEGCADTAPRLPVRSAVNGARRGQAAGLVPWSELDVLFLLCSQQILFELMWSSLHFVWSHRVGRMLTAAHGGIR